MFHIACIPDWVFSWRDYWFATVSAVIGVLIGIFLTQRRFKKDSIILRSRRVESLKQSLKFNIRLLDDSLSWICDKHGLGNFPLDPSTLGDRISACVDDFDPKFLTDLNWERFQLDHLTFKITQTNIKVSSTTDTEKVRQILSDLSDHLRQTRASLSSLLDACESNAKHI